MSATLNPYLEPFWTTQARNKVLVGGRASSKTWDAAGFAVYLASKYKIRVLCTRQFQNKIEESVYTTLKKQIERFGLNGEYTILNNKITHNTTGSEFIFYGLWRNIDEIKSLEDIDICWIEEAHNLTQEQWEILEPTIRKDNSEFWIIFNPRLVTDFTYQRFVVSPPPDSIVCHINYTHNLFLSKTILKVIEAKKLEDEEEFKHIYLGQPKLDDNDAIIKRTWVLAALNAHEKLNIKPFGKKVIGFDVADGGEDTNAAVTREGILTTGIVEWKAEEHELLKSATKVYNIAKPIKALVNYDSIGVGASMGAKFKELNNLETDSRHHVRFIPFNAGAGVVNPDSIYAGTEKTNKEHFANLKAQAWWSVADRFKITYNAVINNEPYNEADIISIDEALPQLEKLITELTQAKKDEDSLGRIKVESKKDLKKRKIKSPNIADAFIMSYFDTSKFNSLLAAMKD